MTTTFVDNDAPLTLSDGSETSLAKLTAEGPIALVFLRHFGCAFCRQIIRQFKKSPELPIVFVGMNDAATTESYRKRQGSPHRFISDPGRALYRAFRMERGSFAQFMNRRVIARSFQLAAQGVFHTLPTSDPMQMGGAVVLAQGGRLTWEFHSADQADNPKVEDITYQLDRAREKA